MKTVKFTFLIAILASVFLSSCSYNTMVEKQEATSSQWGQVQNAYQRRADLIPNLVATVKGYATHEEQTLTEVVNARAKATQITVNAEDLSEENLKKYQEAQGQLSAALGKLLMVQEQYPDLKANTNFLQLQGELSALEGDIEKSRRYYNGTVRENNILVDTFPSNIIANMFKFTKSVFFELDNIAERAVPSIKF